MKRRVAREVAWADRNNGLGRDGRQLPEPGPKVKRRAKRRINRLERRERKGASTNVRPASE